MDHSLNSASPQSEPVIVLTNTLRFGGTERNVKALCENLPEHWNPEIFCFDADGESKLPVKRLERSFKLDPFFVFRFAKLLREHPAKIVHVFHVTIGIYFLMANCLLSKRQKKHAIFSFGSARNDRFFTKSFMKWVNRRAFAVTGNSTAVRARLEAFGIDKSKVSVVANGHDLARFSTSETKQALRNKLGCSEDVFAFITTGRLIASKRHVDAIAALKSVHESIPNFEFWVIGDGPMDQELKQEAARQGLSDNVKFLGFQKNVPEWLLAADVFLFPSETEGLPNSVIEAALSRLPIVACPIDGVVDIIVDGENGILVPVHSPERMATAIQSLVESENLRAQLGNRAREVAEKKFSVPAMIEGFTAIYQRAIDSSA